MNTATPRLLSAPEIRALSARSNRHGAIRIALHALAILAAGALVARAHGWALVPALMALGIAQAALFAPVHETMHGTAFRSRRANAMVGWLAACPALLNREFYTAFHLAHHRFTQDPARDPELAVPPPALPAAYALRVLGINYWRLRLAVIRDAWRGDLSAYPYVSDAAAPRIVASVRWMCALIVALALLAGFAFGWRAVALYWLIPQLLGQIALRLYLLTEHTGCEETRNGLFNTRTTLTARALRLLMWNMPYHAEHHLYPSIPFHRLPAAHEALRHRLGVVQHGYTAWHAGFLRRIVRGAPGFTEPTPDRHASVMRDR